MQLTALCRSRDGWDEVDDLQKILELRRDPQRLVWAESDVSDATEDDVRDLMSGFALDELAIEDALDARQRPKLEPYPGHLLGILYELDEIEDQLEGKQVAAFVGTGFVIVLHHGADRVLREARHRLTSQPTDGLTTDALLHVLLDTVVDDYEATTEQLGEEVEDLEFQAITAAQHRNGARTELPSQYRLYTVKQHVSMLRRFALPLARSMERFAPSTGDEALEATARQFRDVEDHLLRLNAQVRSIDELATGVLDLTRSIQTDALNNINKKLSGWGAIIAAPVLIAGLYGTNYELLPGQSWGAWGFLFVVALMIMSSTVLYVFFKRRDWI